MNHSGGGTVAHSALFLPGKTQKPPQGQAVSRSGHFQILSERDIWAGVWGWGTKGGGKPPWDRQGSHQALQPRLPGCPPHASSPRLHCRSRGCWEELRHLSGPTGLDLLHWDRCAHFPVELTAYCEVLLGAISRIPPQVHHGLTGCPITNLSA